jgi:hypothetical protein
MAATLSLSLTTDLAKAEAWSAAMRKQLPFAISKALNDTAFDARKSLGGATRQYFDRPTTFTQKGFQLDKSTKRNLEVIVGAEAKRARYLRTQITGGARSQKGFERLFLSQITATAQLPRDSQFIPTSLVKLNASGNVSLATLRRIKQGLSTTNARGGFFVGTPKGGDRPPGIYRRSRKQLFPYFIAIDQAAQYQPRFPMLEVVGKVYQRRYGGYFRSALERAIATAR